MGVGRERRRRGRRKRFPAVNRLAYMMETEFRINPRDGAKWSGSGCLIYFVYLFLPKLFIFISLLSLCCHHKRQNLKIVTDRRGRAQLCKSGLVTNDKRKNEREGENKVVECERKKEGQVTVVEGEAERREMGGLERYKDENMQKRKLKLFGMRVREREKVRDRKGDPMRMYR
jgi:hypothetical protein